MSEEREVIDSFPGVYICWKDTQSVFRGCNVNFAALFGKTPDEMIGIQDTVKHHVHDDRIVLETKEPKYDIHETIEIPTGVKMNILTQKGLWKNKHGDILGIVVCFTKAS